MLDCIKKYWKYILVAVVVLMFGVAMCSKAATNTPKIDKAPDCSSLVHAFQALMDKEAAHMKEANKNAGPRVVDFVATSRIHKCLSEIQAKILVSLYIKLELTDMDGNKSFLCMRQGEAMFLVTRSSPDKPPEAILIKPPNTPAEEVPCEK